MNTAWKVYWALIVAQVIGGIGFIVISLISEINQLAPLFYVYFVFGIIGAIGLHGFVYKKAYVNNIIWLIFSILYLCFELVVFTGVINIFKANTEVITDYSEFIYLLPYVPQFYGLFKYSKSDYEVWEYNAT